MTENTETNTGDSSTESSEKDEGLPRGVRQALASSSSPVIGLSVIKIKDVILPDDWNREKLNGVAGLAQSIKGSGLINPLTVIPVKETPGKYLLRAGRRRFAALQELKRTEVPVNILPDMTPGQARLMSLAENENRQGHNPYELALAYERLVADGYSHKEIALNCGNKTEGHVSQYRGILRTPDYIQKAVRDEKIPVSATRLLLKLDYETDKMLYDGVAQGLIDKTLSLEDAGDQIDGYLSKKETQAEASGKGKPARKSGAKTKAEKKRGAKIRITDYSGKDVLKKISPLPKREVQDRLILLSKKLEKTSNKKNVAALQSGIREIEFCFNLRNE
jgi:ParB family transcriptional regulator, chromosome partitioning protein